MTSVRRVTWCVIQTGNLWSQNKKRLLSGAGTKINFIHTAASQRLTCSGNPAAEPGPIWAWDWSEAVPLRIILGLFKILSRFNCFLFPHLCSPVQLWCQQSFRWSIINKHFERRCLCLFSDNKAVAAVLVLTVGLCVRSRDHGTSDLRTSLL